MAMAAAVPRAPSAFDGMQPTAVPLLVPWAAGSAASGRRGLGLAATSSAVPGCVAAARPRKCAGAVVAASSSAVVGSAGVTGGAFGPVDSNHCSGTWGISGQLRRRLTATVAMAAASALRRRRKVQKGEVSPLRFVHENIPKPEYCGPNGPKPPTSSGHVSYPKHAFSDTPEVKSAEQIERMRRSCALAREALELAGKSVAVGVTTEEIDKVVHNFIVSRGAYPSPLGYMGFPKAVCTSVNEVLCHGIPDSRELADGDILNIDVTVYLDGYHGDTSSMFIAGKPNVGALRLCEATHKAMSAGISVCGPGVDFRQIGKAISKVAGEEMCFCSPFLTGHGIGSYFHGAPDIVHVNNNKDQGVMKPGMTFTIEPVLVEKMDSSRLVWPDGWTIVTKGALSAQFEHTVLITEEGHEVLTGPSIDYKAIASLGTIRAAKPQATRPLPRRPARRRGFT